MKDPSHALGVETGVYRVKFGFAYFGMYALCLALSGLGILMFMGVASVGEKIGAAIFTVFLSLPLVFLVLRTVPAIFDELRVFENGFTYKSRKGIATCLWSQVKDRAGILDVDNRIKVASVEKRNKEKIVFAFGMRGLDVIARELDKYEFSKIPRRKR
ncbi:MAG: hypothetical protein UZ17_ACD001001356 [Acidobacteria bacterium OLB17]|nr:MAG: hypothetical protein UZ17_ACD001001356 [Acidobacteria bacterium OLB17]